MLLVAQLTIVGLRTQQIQFHNRCPHIHAITTSFIYFHDTGGDRRIDDFLNSWRYLTRCCHAYLNGASAHLTHRQFIPINAGAHQAHHNDAPH